MSGNDIFLVYVLFKAIVPDLVPTGFIDLCFTFENSAYPFFWGTAQFRKVSFFQVSPWNYF